MKVQSQAGHYCGHRALSPTGHPWETVCHMPQSCPSKEVGVFVLPLPSILYCGLILGELAPWNIRFIQLHDKYQGGERPAVGLDKKGKHWEI